MAIEIERKFLVERPAELIPWESASEVYEVVQGYLMSKDNKILRVTKAVPIKTKPGRHLPEPHGVLCFKIGINPLKRIEIEHHISFDEAYELLKHCEGHLIEKTRYWFNTMTEDEVDPIWEVDVFHGVNHGLIVAEVELPSENYPIVLPPFIGQDVSNDVRYSNAMLSVVPFKEWNGKPNQVH